jgi:hypothetical protein
MQGGFSHDEGSLLNRNQNGCARVSLASNAGMTLFKQKRCAPRVGSGKSSPHARLILLAQGLRGHWTRKPALRVSPQWLAEWLACVGVRTARHVLEKQAIEK